VLEMHHGLIVVDHHHPHPDTVKVASQMIVDESAAAARIVFRLSRLPTKILKGGGDCLDGALFVENETLPFGERVHV